MGLAPARGAEVPSPEAHLGFRPGADFRLADWPTVVDYFRKVDDRSDRVRVRELGKSTEGRPYLVAIVSNEATIRDLGRHQDAQKRIAQPSGDDAKTVADAKPVVLITCSIHSTETASTFMAMKLLHDLASGEDAATRRRCSDNTILILVPSANPDGVDKVAAWYERSQGQALGGRGDARALPQIRRARHQPRLVHAQPPGDEAPDPLLYNEWPPTLAYDVHQMGPRGARLFVPPFFDPINPNLDPRVNQGIALVGAHMAADLAAAGKTGVLTNAMYDNWWNGGNRTTPQRHNMSWRADRGRQRPKLASPIFLDKCRRARAAIDPGLRRP